MDRRNFLKLAALAELALLCPWASSAPAQQTRYSGPFVLTLHASGGWDPTMLFDPKLPYDGKPINKTYTELGQLGAFPFAPIDLGEEYTDPAGERKFFSAVNLQKFLEQWGSNLLVINGIDFATNNHDTGTRTIWSGKVAEELPAIGALLAGKVSRELNLPCAFLSDGSGYDRTAGVVPITRARQGQIRRLAYPNRSNPDNGTSLYLPEAAHARILAAQAERLAAVQAIETLPRAKDTAAELASARDGMSNLRYLADTLPAKTITARDAFPFLGDRVGGNDFDSALQQVELSLTAFQAGVAVSANVGQIGGFDTHNDNDQSQRRQLAKLLLAYQYALIKAQELGIRDKLYVLVSADFGRTPWYNERNGKDHWNVSSMLLTGPGIPGGRTLGASDAQQRPLSVLKTDATKVVADSDPSGTRIKAEHIHRELRRVLGLTGTDLDQRFALPFSDEVRLFG